MGLREFSLRLPEQSTLKSFEETVLPHLDAAHNLARWLTHNAADAEDVVQEAYLRAFKFFGSFHGGNSRAWLLTIVRNTSYTWLQEHRSSDLFLPFDEEAHDVTTDALNPEALLLQDANNELIRDAVAQLPLEFREVVILRELEDLSYKEIVAISRVPVGTVMSRLARARKRLQQSLTASFRREEQK